MKIGIVGATGKQGTLLLLEAIKRGHEVTALIRNHEKLTQDVPFIEKELYDLTEKEVAEFDILVDAFNAPKIMPQLHQTSLRHLAKILKHGTTRLYVVGGAGSLFVDEGETTRLFETEDFPEAFLPVAKSMFAALEELKATKATHWTYVSPAADFDFEGETTGQYTIANNHLTLNSENKSYISYVDYAKGFLDIIEDTGFDNEHISIVSK